MSKSAEKSLEALLEEARHRIEVTKAELDEARKRRSALAEALRTAFPGSRIYFNGSVAHGDALTPLTDVDLGVVVRNPDQKYGPGKAGPGVLMEQARDAIRDALGEDYPKLTVTVEGQKRSVLVRFGDPVTAGQTDFTADVIVAIDNLTGAGLYIPRVPGWDRSDPETHTKMILAAIEQTEVSFALIVRLLKHWNRTHDKPLCSWNIKALALGCLLGSTRLVDGLLTWFRYAETELARQETPDPAHVAPRPIKTNKPRTEVVRTIRDARERLERAIKLEAGGYLVVAQDELARLFNDELMLRRPDRHLVREQEATRISDEQAKAFKHTGTPALLTGIGVGADRPRIDAASWAE